MLPRNADRTTSELAALWHEGRDGTPFEASLADLRARLEAASEGARERPTAKTGDVITLLVAPSSTERVMVQVVGPGEVAVFEGTCDDEAVAREWVKNRPARRVPTSVSHLLRRGRPDQGAALRNSVASLQAALA